MISLKPYLYGSRSKKDASESNSELSAVLGSYAASLTAFGKAAAQDGSVHGIELERHLAELEQRLTEDAKSRSVEKIGNQVLSHVEQWGDLLVSDSKTKADEVKELLIALAKIAESVGSRDQTYNAEFRQLTGQLEKVADLNDLTLIKTLLVKHVAELKNSVDHMARDNQQLVLQLKEQVTLYQNRLKAAEDIAFKDELSGIPNRRFIERQIVWNIKHNEPFSVLMIDLNGFKAVNDQYGHNAGDDLLKQFSTELRSRTRATDIVGRWGGDEFMVIMKNTAAEARVCVERIRSWVFGKYTIKVERDGSEAQVLLNAAIGLAQWRIGMTGQQVIAEADAHMYEDKRSSPAAG